MVNENFREKLELLRISMTASHLIAGVRRESTTAIYEPNWRKWVGWCSGKETNPFLSDMNLILEFLGDLFEARYEYS